MNAKSYAEIDATAEAGIKLAAERIGAKANDVRDYYLAGGEWDATTAEELADEIARCWAEQAATK